MNRKCKWFYAIVIVMFMACTSVPTEDIMVGAETNPKADLSGYKNYAWLATAQIVYDPYGQWETPSFDADAEIKYLIDRQLRKRGMLENTSDPDVIVAFALGIDMKPLQLIDPETQMDMLETVPKGGLVVVLVDTQTGYAIWAGTATADVLENPDDQTVKARLDYAVTKMFKKLPK